LFWSAAKRFEIDMKDTLPPVAARFSPRDKVVALVDDDRVALFDLAADPPRRVQLTLEHGVGDPSELHFSPGGLDLAVCNREGEGRWLYLRSGERPEEDGPAPPEAQACRPEHAGPAPLGGIRDYGEPVLQAKNLGPRLYAGGYKRKDGTLITRDLVRFDPKDARLDRLIGFSERNPNDVAGVSAAGVTRDGDDVVWQVGGDVRSYGVEGKEKWRRPGNLLLRCPDGRLLAWRKAGEPKWEIFDARDGTSLRSVARKPGFVLGADPSCRRMFFQELDGHVASVTLAGGAAELVTPQRIDPGGGGYVIDGYAYDARPSAGGERTGTGDARETVEPGLWLAFSSGAMVRADASGTIASYGHASPRATAMADGPTAGDLMFADETGVVLRAKATKDKQLLPPSADREWSDARLFPDKKHALVASATMAAVLDVERGELVGEVEVPARGRIAPWDSEGSMLLWAYSFMGPPRGDVVPIGRALAVKVGQSASNLLAEITPEGRPLMRLR
jgi:hypothetical protein